MTSAAPGYVRLLAVPDLAAPGESLGEPLVYGITRRAAWLTCDAAHLYLHVIWSADRRPEGDPSIFVHLTGDTPAPNPLDADSRHPVYGLYPFAQMSPGQLVRDDFTLPRLPDMMQVRFGLYEQTGAGFVNMGRLRCRSPGASRSPGRARSRCRQNVSGNVARPGFPHPR